MNTFSMNTFILNPFTMRGPGIPGSQSDSRLDRGRNSDIYCTQGL